MTTYKKITVKGIEFEMEIEMYDSRDYGLIKLSRGEYCEHYTWLYFEETLNERLKEIEDEVLEDYEYFSHNYSL